MRQPVRSHFLPFCRPTIEEDEIREVVDSLASGWITTGPKVARFEQMFSEYLGAPHAIAVSSATAGWHIVVLALDIGQGDEVIVPSITWPSVANIVELAGARAVFADVCDDTLQIDPADVARRITPRTRAIVPVHYAGAPADLDALREVIGGRDILLIEDAAHALGTAYRGRLIGADSPIAIFSFHAIKNITTGEGGMIVCRDGPLAQRLRLLRFHGIDRDAGARYGSSAVPDFEVIEPGYKYNMLDLQAAIGLHQLPKLERFNRRRAELAARYDHLLASLDEVRPIGRVAYPSQHAFHLYAVRLRLDALDLDRNGFVAALGEENVGAGIHFPAIHQKRYYRNRPVPPQAALPCATRAGEELLSLPLHPSLTEAEQDDVVRALHRVVQGHRTQTTS